MRSDIRDPLPQEQLLVFELPDLLLKGAHDGGDGRFDDPLDILLDLFFDGREARAQCFGFRLDVRLFAPPHLLEHRSSEFDDLGAWLGRTQDRLELAFDHIAADRLAVALTAFARALVIGMPLARLAAAGGPAGRQRPRAIIAQHRAPERELTGKVAAVDRAQAIEPVLNALMRLQSDERLVVTLAPLDIPLGSFDIARIDRVTQHVAHALMRKLAAFGLREERMLFEKPLHVRLASEATQGVAFQRLDDDRRGGFLTDQHLAVQSGDLAVTIPSGRGEHGKAVLQARPHPVQRLLGVVDPVVVGERDRDILHQARRGSSVEHARRGFEEASGLVDRAPQIGMLIEIARPAVQMVEDDVIAALGVRLDEADHGAKAGAAAFAARELVAEHANDVVFHAQGIFPEPRLLGGQAVAFAVLLLAGNPAIDDGERLLRRLCFVEYLFHGAELLTLPSTPFAS